MKLNVETAWTYSRDLDRYDVFAELSPEWQSRLGYDSIRVFCYPESSTMDFLPWHEGEEAMYATIPDELRELVRTHLPPRPKDPSQAFSDF